MVERRCRLAENPRAHPAGKVPERLSIHVRWNSKQRSYCRLLHMLRPQQRVKVSVAGMPPPVVGAIETVRLDFGVNRDARVVNATAAGPEESQLEFVVLQRADAVLDPLEAGRKKPDDVEHGPAE